MMGHPAQAIVTVTNNSWIKINPWFNLLCCHTHPGSFNIFRSPGCPVFRQGFKFSNTEYLQHKSNKMIHSLTSVGILFWIPGTLVQSHFRDPDKDFVSRAEALYFSHFNTTKVRCSSVNCGLSTILL